MFEKHMYVKKSYSQSGEDLILDFIFKSLKIKKPTYIDIGAHHPFYLSNTAIFYEAGCNGICIEPNPNLFKIIKKHRKNDICLNIGIGVEKVKDKKFYLTSTPSLDTFSDEQASDYSEMKGIKIKRIINVPMENLNEIVNKYCKKTPDFISLDVEGLDYDILKSIDFNKLRPLSFCIETLTYSQNNNEKKIKKIIDYMLLNDYLLYADTYINSIFVDRNKWENR